MRKIPWVRRCGEGCPFFNWTEPGEVFRCVLVLETHTVKDLFNTTVHDDMGRFGDLLFPKFCKLQEE